MTYLCGPSLPDYDWPDAGEGGCCWGTASGGPRCCTCWEPVYDLPDRAAPSTDIPSNARPAMCPDCAYRPGSPERRGDAHVSGDADQLEQIVATGQPFYCHQGIPRVTAYRHPTGALFTPPPEATAAAYEPRMRDGVPYKADGTPADLCAGWTARRLKHLQRDLREEVPRA